MNSRFLNFGVGFVRVHNRLEITCDNTSFNVPISVRKFSRKFTSASSALATKSKEITLSLGFSSAVGDSLSNDR
jgi:hypothetical protein